MAIADHLLTKEDYSVVYFIGAENGLVKIGFASDFNSRMGKLYNGSPVPLFPLAATHSGYGVQGYRDTKIMAAIEAILRALAQGMAGAAPSCEGGSAPPGAPSPVCPDAPNNRSQPPGGDTQ